MLTRALLRVSLDFKRVHCSNDNLTWSLRFSVFVERWVQAKLKREKNILHFNHYFRTSVRR